MLKMSRFILLLWTIASLVFSADSHDARQQVQEYDHMHIDVYYEALCSDSVNFIRDQLFPVYREFSDFVVIDWIPYGKATHRRGRDGSFSFRCQHGSQECLGNKIQACAIDVLSHMDAARWIACVMNTHQPQSAGARCSRSLGVDYERIRACSTNGRGDQLLARYGDMTHALRPRLSFVPTVTFNGVYDSARQNRALRDLRSVVCSYMSHRYHRGRCH